MKKNNIRQFLSDRDAVEAWLLGENETLKKREASLSFWFHEKGVGLLIHSYKFGEFHAFKDGTVTMHIDESIENPMYSDVSKVVDKNTLFNFFEHFKNKVLRE